MIEELVLPLDLSAKDPATPLTLRNLFLHSICGLSPAELIAANSNPRQLVAPMLQLLASSYLADLQLHSALKKGYFQDPGRPYGGTRRFVALWQFEVDLLAVRELCVSAQEFFGSIGPRPTIIKDLEYLRERYETVDQHRRAQIGYEASVASLEESKLGIELSKAGLTQNQSVKRLTQLAFIFIPLSFLTSVFGMNIDVLAGDGARWWTVIIGGVIVYILVGLSYLGVLEIEKSQVWRISRKEQSQDRELESLAHP